jgi:hypothetical protein
MDARKIGLVMLVALLSLSLAQNQWTPIGEPLPKPVPPVCPSDVLCW